MVRKFLDRWMMPFSATDVGFGGLNNYRVTKMSEGAERNGDTFSLPDGGSLHAISYQTNKNGDFVRGTAAEIAVSDSHPGRKEKTLIRIHRVPKSVFYEVSKGLRRIIPLPGYGNVVVINKGKTSENR